MSAAGLGALGRRGGKVLFLFAGSYPAACRPPPLVGSRDQLTTKADPLFIECRTRVLSAIQQSKVVAPV
ncbi:MULTISPECIES: hypothetical protein [Rhodococcus]|uniref:hypothetical protein n=1 Tax=Rhodococcus TaxID=1827 RepID=UPI001E4EAEC7|nr:MULTISPECIES: hypothetical protein [Rhodococcus]